MSSLKEIKSRIASVRNTLKITSAMKMVASAKLHKAQVAIGGKLPYEQKLHHILSGLLQDDDLQKAMHDKLGFGGPHGHSAVVLEDIGLDQIPSKEKYPRIAIVAFSSNSSLCGAFNANAIKKYLETITLSRQTFVDKVMSLLFNMLSRLVIAFLLWSKNLLISWLQSPPAVILEPPE